MEAQIPGEISKAVTLFCADRNIRLSMSLPGGRGLGNTGVFGVVDGEKDWSFRIIADRSRDLV